MQSACSAHGERDWIFTGLRPIYRGWYGLIDYWLCCLQGRAVRSGRAIFCLSLWCFGPLSAGSCFKPSLPRGRDVRDKGHKGPQDQYSFVSIYGDHAIGVMSSVFRASPRDRWPDNTLGSCLRWDVWSNLRQISLRVFFIWKKNGKMTRWSQKTQNMSSFIKKIYEKLHASHQSSKRTYVPIESIQI